MDIRTTSIGLIQPGQKVSDVSKTAENETSFSEFMKKAINEVNTLDQQSSDLKTKLVSGQVQDLHQVMIAAEKAGIAFQMTVQIRNKVVEAYQEIMRMQV